MSFPSPAFTQADRAYMRLALDQAAIGLADRHFPCGCVLVLDGRVLAASRNRVYAAQNPTCHAEMEALDAAFAGHSGSLLLSGTTAYCTIEPCLMCAGGLIGAGVRRVIYGAAAVDPGFPSTAVILQQFPIWEHLDWRGGLCANASTTLLVQWQRYKAALLQRAQGMSHAELACLLEAEALSPAHLEAWRDELATGVGKIAIPKNSKAVQIGSE